MLRAYVKALLEAIARTRAVRSIVGNLIYPTVVLCLLDEIRPDVVSPSGLLEAISWKAHAYLVLNEELRHGIDCSADGMRCDRESRTRLFDVILRDSPLIDGDILEFGVYSGESLMMLAEHCPQRRIFGFDSFEGLPAPWWTRPKGAFHTAAPQLDAPNVTLVKGLYEESVPRFVKEWSGVPAVIHVDCDLYESTRACLMPILPRCQVGTIILFDEYYNYSDFAMHEWRAWREFRAIHKIVAPCIAYDGRRAAFRIHNLAPLIPSP